MSQHYSDSSREHDKWSLPDIETFEMRYRYCPDCDSLMQDEDGAGNVDCQECNHRLPATETGWFYWFCFPGCMPDSDPSGPYATEAEALEAARESAGY